MEKNISTNKTTIKKLQKKKALIQAGAKIFAKEGFINSSIKSITDEAQVAVGTFYSYFNSKEDVLSAIYDDILRESIYSSRKIADGVKNSDDVSFIFTKALTEAVLIYARNKEASKIVLSKGAGINEVLEEKRFQLIDKTIEYIEDVLNHLNSVHSIKIADIKITSIMITQSILGVITYWIKDRISDSIDQMILSICIFQLNALNISFDESKIKNCITSIVKQE